MGPTTSLFPQLQQSIVWLFLKVSQDSSVASGEGINQQRAFSCALANLAATIPCQSDAGCLGRWGVSTFRGTTYVLLFVYFI